MKKILLLFFLCSWVMSMIEAQESGAVASRIELELESKILDQTRRVFIDLPASYHQGQDHHHVLYLFDAHWKQLAEAGVAIARYLEDVGDVYPLIIVGVEQIERSKEFTPPLKSKVDENDWYGEAEAFQAFLKQELVPYIDEHFRTHPFRVAIGHSLGGLFVTHALIQDRDLFQAVIAISPAYRYDKEQLLEQLPSWLYKGGLSNNRLYFTNGDQGNTDVLFLPSVQKADSILQAQATPDFRWKFEFLPGEDHNTTPLPSMSKGLKYVYEEWYMSDSLMTGIFDTQSLDPLVEVVKHYSILSERVGYNVVPPASLLNSVGYVYMGNEEPEKALTVFQLALGYYPEDANLYDSKGEALEAAGQLEQARDHYKMALDRIDYYQNEEDRSYYESVFSDHLKAVEEKIKQGK